MNLEVEETNMDPAFKLKWRPSTWMANQLSRRWEMGKDIVYTADQWRRLSVEWKDATFRVSFYFIIYWIHNNWFNRENNMVTRNCFLNNYYHITFEKVGLLPVFFTVGPAWTDASSCSDWNDWRLVARQIEIWSHIIGVRTDSYGDAWALLLVLIKHWRP